MSDTFSKETLLDVRDLSVRFRTRDGVVQAVSDLSFTLRRGETLGIVGESGSGKSVTSLAIMGLLNRSYADITGEIVFEGTDLLKLSPKEMRAVRGEDVSMIFQDPFASLHPLYRVGDQIAEAILVHSDMSKKAASERVVEMLDSVGIPNARSRARDYPHQFSGGMRQRAMIAMGLINNPDVLIADEPTTALDVTVQAQILGLIDQVKKDFNIGVILITHDLGVVAETASQVMVMYAGRAMEQGTTEQIFNSPQHPYTWGLLDSMPSVERKLDALIPIEGAPPSMLAPPLGCPFHPRCRHRFSRCNHERPPLKPIPDGHLDACFLTPEQKHDNALRRSALALPPLDVRYAKVTGAQGHRDVPRSAGRPIVLVLVLWLVTVGIYGLIWAYGSYRDVKQERGHGVGGFLGLLLSLTPVTAFLLPSNTGKMYREAGREAPLSGWIGLWVLVPIVGWAIWIVKLQNAFNSFWAQPEQLPAVGEVVT